MMPHRETRTFDSGAGGIRKILAEILDILSVSLLEDQPIAKR